MFLQIIVTVIILAFSCYFCIKYYHKCESFLEKVFFILFFVMEIFVILLYYLDRYNIPTLLNWDKNVDTQNWLSILATYGGSIIMESFSGIILFFITMMQLKRTTEDNEELNKEERRINNLPLLRYTFEAQAPDDLNTKCLDTIITSDGQRGEIILGIKNVGMNTTRKCYIQISSDILEEDYCYELDDKQGLLEKNEERFIQFLLNLKFQKYDFIFNIYYQDLSFNWYMQKIKLEYEFLSKIKDGHYCSIKKPIIEDEIKLNEKPELVISFE